MKVRVGIGGSIIVDDDVHPLNVNTTTEDISGHKDAFFESLECGVSADTKWNRQVSNPKRSNQTYRSSWARPEWILILGKLQETSNLSNSIARATDFTKMTTYSARLNNRSSQRLGTNLVEF